MTEGARETIIIGANLTLLAAVLFIGMMFFNLRGMYAKNTVEIKASERLLIQASRYSAYDNKVLNGTEVIEALTRYYDSVPIFVDRAYNYKLKDGWLGSAGAPNRKGLYSAALVAAHPEKLLLESDSTKVPGDNTLTYWFPSESQYAAVLCYNAAHPYDYAVQLLTNGYLQSNPSALIKSDDLFKKVDAKRDKSEVSGIIFILLSNAYAPNTSVYH